MCIDLKLDDCHFVNSEPVVPIDKTIHHPGTEMPTESPYKRSNNTAPRKRSVARHTGSETQTDGSPEPRENKAPPSEFDHDTPATWLEATTLLETAQHETQSSDEPHPLHRLRMFIVAGAFLIYSVAHGGLVYGRAQLVLWIILALTVFNLGKSDGATLQAIKDWTPLVILGVAYDYSRGAADTLGFPTHWSLPISFDEAVFGEVPTVALQRWLNMGEQTHWWEALTAIVYVSHFLVSYAILGVLWQRSRDHWRRYFMSFITLTLSGLATYIALPTAPPWLASHHGHIGEVARTTQAGWSYLGIGIANTLISMGQAAVNDVAALPSLHLAFSALPLFMLWGRSGRAMRCLLGAYPLAMGFTIVSSGEHYVFDVVVGFLYAGLSASVANRIVDRRERKAAFIESHAFKADA